MSTRDLCRVVELMQTCPEHSLISHMSLSLTRPNAPPQVATMHGTHAYCIYIALLAKPRCTQAELNCQQGEGVTRAIQSALESGIEKNNRIKAPEQLPPTQMFQEIKEKEKKDCKGLGTM